MNRAPLLTTIIRWKEGGYWIRDCDVIGVSEEEQCDDVEEDDDAEHVGEGGDERGGHQRRVAADHLISSGSIAPISAPVRQMPITASVTTQYRFQKCPVGDFARMLSGVRK